MAHSLTTSDPHTQVWRDVRTYLEFERDEGRTVIPLSNTAHQRMRAWLAAERPSASAPAPQPTDTAPRQVVRPAAASSASAKPSGPAMTPPAKSSGTGSTPALDAIAREIAGCTLCTLAATRHCTVPGHGNPHPDLMFIGEAPGESEDRQGLPFVGRSGALLTRMITNLGMSRDEVFIANILKCRPPGNRTPTPKERETCLPYLKSQIDTLRPKVIVTLGATALRGLLGNDKELAGSRGVWHEYRGIPLMPTYHPSYLLRNLKARFITWDDMLKVLERLGRRPPEPPSAAK